MTISFIAVHINLSTEYSFYYAFYYTFTIQYIYIYIYIIYTYKYPRILLWISGELQSSGRITGSSTETVLFHRFFTPEN